MPTSSIVSAVQGICDRRTLITYKALIIGVGLILHSKVRTSEPLICVLIFPPGPLARVWGIMALRRP